MVVTERARLEIVQNQLIQFVEILSIKIRRRIMMFRTQADIIREQLVRAGDTSVIHVQSGAQNAGGGASGVSNSNLSATSQIPAASSFTSALTMFGPKWTIGFGALSVLSFSYLGSRIINNIKFAIFIIALKQGHEFSQKWQLGSTLNKLDNFLNAFGENGDDELESERIVRHVAKSIGLRHVNQISRLSKNGQVALSAVIVDRISQSLMRHPYGYKNESRSWIVNEVQHRIWATRSFYESFTRPADRVRTRETLSLIERCTRALTNEMVPYDDRPVELEHYLSNNTPMEQERWTAAGVLSKCGVCVQLADSSTELYAHSASETEKYGFCYGTMAEVKDRKMRLQTQVYQSKL
uniref:Uncharacterized protein n=1 Tax=Aplanochytrium stocchinoi TaxID=215587 RepID=A0A7S3LGG4_9STRA